MFQKGQSGNPAGMKKGTLHKRTRNYLDLQMWAQLIADNADSLTAKEKIEIGFRALNALLPKIANLPATPGESVRNAQLKAEELQGFEQLPQNADEPIL